MTAPRPTLDTVAKAAGVSRMTVSNAYNRADQLSEQTREMVLRVARELGYPGPNPAGRSLRRRRADTIGVLLAMELPYAFADPGLMSFLHGVATELSASGQALLLLTPPADADQALVRNALVDGFVLVSMAPSDPAVHAVLERRLPVVAWGSSRLPGVVRVRIDNGRGVAKVAKHLLDLGHRRFGVVTLVGGGTETTPVAAPQLGSDTLVPRVRMVMRQRVAGFLRVLADAGIDTDAVPVVQAERNSRDGGARAVARLLAMRPAQRPTAIFATTDVLAFGVLDAAAAAGVAVPGRLSVAGFDDVAEAEHSTPPLTTVSQSLFEQGRVAARATLDLVEGHEPNRRRIGTELVERASTAPPP